MPTYIYFDGNGSITDGYGPIRRPHTSFSSTSWGNRFGGTVRGVAGGTCTIWPGQNAIGDSYTVFGDNTITAKPGVTFRYAGTATTGTTVTVPPNGICMVLCVGTNEYVFSGSGISLA